MREEPTVGEAREGLSSNEAIVETEELETALEVSSDSKLSDGGNILRSVLPSFEDSIDGDSNVAKALSSSA